jgi:hypothetical protein
VSDYEKAKKICTRIAEHSVDWEGLRRQMKDGKAEEKAFTA